LRGHGFSSAVTNAARSMATASTTPLVYRLRVLFIGLAYGIGFFFGYPLQIALTGHAAPTIVVVGRHMGASGVEVAAWIAAALTIAAWLVRLWGSSYHSPGVVMGYEVVTSTFTAAGPYRYVRNPLYLGNVLLAIGIGVLGPPIATVLVVALNLLVVYLLIFAEERSLHAAMGDSYDRYRRLVPRLFPRFTPAPLDDDRRKPDLLRGFITEFAVLGFAIATTFVAILVASGSGDQHYVGPMFWSIGGLAIALQVVFGAIGRRAGSQESST
jgi:protein-S-isoprenylcysteine O-methyltransferase Ste14